VGSFAKEIVGRAGETGRPATADTTAIYARDLAQHRHWRRRRGTILERLR
jgi:hypothetical protein